MVASGVFVEEKVVFVPLSGGAASLNSITGLEGVAGLASISTVYGTLPPKSC